MATEKRCECGHVWMAGSNPAADTTVACPACGSTSIDVRLDDEAARVDDLPPPPTPLVGASSATAWSATAPAGVVPPATSGGSPSTELPYPPGLEILAEIGRGGMGVVYKARQISLDRIVAVKTIDRLSRQRPELQDRLITEALAVAKLNHPHITQIHEVSEHDGVPYFVMEYVDGGGLHERHLHSPYSPEDAAALVEKLARAVAYAHSHKLVHRDLKPANVLLTRDGEPKITDFGLAKWLDRGGQTKPGVVMGTPAYMAPEQAEGRSDQIGSASDVYSLGAVLYELLTGQPPFRGGSALATLKQVVSDPPAPIREGHPEVPAELETICLRCLEKKPDDRFASAGLLAKELRRFLDGDSKPKPAPPPARATRPAVMMAAGVLVCALIAGVAMLWSPVRSALWPPIPPIDGADGAVAGADGDSNVDRSDGAREAGDGASEKAGQSPRELMRDEFAANVVGDAWEIWREDNSRLAVSDGRLMIVTQYAAAWDKLGATKNVVVRTSPISAEDFEIEADISIRIVNQYQGAALLLVQDEKNFIELSYYGDPYGYNVNRVFRLTKCVDGHIAVFTHSWETGAAEKQERFRLKIVKRDVLFTGYFANLANEIDVNWVEVGEQAAPTLNKLRVALKAANGGEGQYGGGKVGEAPALFDSIVARSIRVEPRERTLEAAREPLIDLDLTDPKQVDASFRVLNEASTHWGVERGLNLVTRFGDLHDEKNPLFNLVLASEELPQQDWDLAVSAELRLTTQHNDVGILLFENSNKYLALGKAGMPWGNNVTRIFYFDKMIDGELGRIDEDAYRPGGAEKSTSVVFRIQKRGPLYTALVDHENETTGEWETAEPISHGIPDFHPKLALFARNRGQTHISYEAAHEALVRFYRVTLVPASAD